MILLVMLRQDFKTLKGRYFSVAWDKGVAQAPCHGRRRYAFPIRLSRGDDVKVGPRSSDDEVCLSYIYSYD